jgi:muramoyltetrapeptide carboxypeptidase
MIQPPALQPGHTVGIVAPGRKVHPQELHTAQNVFESWGLQVQLGKHVFTNHHAYLAATDAERLEDLQYMMDHEGVHAIVAARGGYGITRILDQLDFSAFLRRPKWVVGFSDLTALHLKLAQVGVQSIHGTMPILFDAADAESSVQSLHNLLTDGTTVLTTGPNKNNRMGTTSGYLIGGNLSLVVDSLGTSSEIETEGKILLLEEVDEYHYKVDRMLVQLKRAGKLDHLAGLVIGHFTDIKDPALPFGESVDALISHHVKPYSYPVAFGFAVGHQQPNLAWRQGEQVTLRVQPTGSRLAV